MRLKPIMSFQDQVKRGAGAGDRDGDDERAKPGVVVELAQEMAGVKQETAGVVKPLQQELAAEEEEAVGGFVLEDDDVVEYPIVQHKGTD